ncbi:MAG: hypothetical protein ISR77_28565 [Pirellulaceae bacterium]|nr:hypothetical protein [Pirellulaceae bacterium]
MKRRYLAILFAVLLCAAAGASYLAWSAHRALVVSHTAVFGKIATEWVTMYVDEHDGRWPRSWDALLDCRSPPVFRNHDPAETIDTLKTVVTIDFQVDSRKIASESVRQFDAIRPIDGHAVDHREYWGVATLIDTIRNYHGTGRADSPARPTPHAR